MSLFTSHVNSRRRLLEAQVPMTAFYSAATLECHAVGTSHDTSPRHIIQTRDRPVVVLSVHADLRAGRHNYLLLSLTCNQIKGIKRFTTHKACCSSGSGVLYSSVYQIRYWQIRVTVMKTLQWFVQGDFRQFRRQVDSWLDHKIFDGMVISICLNIWIIGCSQQWYIEKMF